MILINYHTTYKQLPKCCGIYLFKDEYHNILYIGKAKSLRDRVRSYFNPSNNDTKVHELINAYDHIEHILTNTEKEALLLETKLIQQYQPPFNRLMKEGQPFAYILFTKGVVPELTLVRNKKNKGVYFGPFLNKKAARSTLYFLQKTFNLYNCNKKIDNGCLRYHIGTCSGSCKADFDHEEYLLRIALAKDALKQYKKSFILTIKKQIIVYNEQLAFEKARNLTRYINEVDQIFSTLKLHFDATNFINAIARATVNERHKKVAHNNEEHTLLLQELIKSTTPINTIDCFDISHFQSLSLVGSCVRFINGQPDKKKFRHFNIKKINQQNDYAALHEIVQRRYKNDDFPDLVLIDGGKGQRNAVRDLIPDNVQLASLAKREETLFCVAYPGGIKLDQQNDAHRLLLQLRDYAHHFAITFHRLKRSQKNFHIT
jgi:excinuclease ABC subunit C